jgi:single-strand DNA-binding protein
MNVYTFTGNLGKDCRVGEAGGTAVVNFAVAVKSGWGDKQQTLWIDCALWGKQAESKLKDYLLKGQQVAVSGELGTREHEGKTYLTLRVNSIDPVGGKADPAALENELSQASKAVPAAPAKTQAQQADDFEDDIPF